MTNMQKHLADIPVSVLDLSTIVEGENATGAFTRSLALAQQAEALGYTRYWFAEHHNMESVASSATAVLIGYVAGGTSTIRVGSGGIMLPNHAPLIIAEQFGTLASLYPGRIDLGLGRAPGTDGVTSMALRRRLQNSVDEFPNDVIELINYLGPREEAARVRAIPGEGTEVPVWLLGSSTYSAQLAAMLGLPFAFASHFAPTYLNEALKIYRANFKPSTQLQQPYAIACINVIAADTDDEAEHLATSFYNLALGLIRNKRRPLQLPVASMDDVWTEPEKAAVQQMMHYSFIGSTATVNRGLQSFLEETGVDELMVTSHIYDLEAKKNSYQMIAPFFKRSDAAQPRLH
ncbi:MAG TPA: LLM class flavin-dependent oxidoreductase [Flavisolibacter sp.]|nr:LLM class flavin-dependent oxidoreductase [Flavisolibacter sp.]